jgi:hypothetical protein
VSALSFARRYALYAGIVLPIGETFRRWGTPFGPFWLDDYLIGAFLLYGWWRARSPNGRPILAAAWAFTCGMGYMSVFSHIVAIGEPASGRFSHLTLAVVLGVGLVLAALALLASLREPA